MYAAPRQVALTINPAPLVFGAGPRFISSSADVAARLPDALSAPEVDPVRDALVDALAGLLQEWEARSDCGAALSDPARAIERYLVALAGDRGSAKAPGEDEEAFRARTFQAQQCVTEASIIAGVNVILAPFTSLQCKLNDAALDRWFVHDGTDGLGGPPNWHSFLGAAPEYPDRFYSDAAVNNGGYLRPNSEVGGARVYGDSLGRHFLLRVPDIGFQDTDAAFSFSDLPASGNDLGGGSVEIEGGMFVGDGSDPGVGAFLNSATANAIAVYRAIGNFINAVAGQSIRWSMLSDVIA